MAKTQIKIVFNRLPQIARKLPVLVGAVVQKTAMRVERRAKDSMQLSHSGRRYQRGKKSHQASAPGETPAIDTGNLVNSIGNKMTGPASAEVFVGAEYGAALEFGTSKMAARPSLRPAVDAEQQGFIDEMMKLEGLL